MLTAKDIARDCPQDFVVIAAQQSGGYGRKGLPWASPEGGLWFTLVVTVRRVAGLSLFFSLPLLRALKRYLGGARIKWPNDIWVENKKLAGILTEVHDRAFIGVGVNVNNPIPPELEKTAVSLRSLYGSAVDVRTLLDAILSESEILLPSFEEGGLFPFLLEYQRDLLYVGERVRLQTDDEIVEGILRGVTVEGALQLEVNGELRALHEAGLVLRAN